MKLFIDLSKKQLIKSAASNVAHERLVLKRRDSLAIEVVFVSRNAVASMPAGTTTTVALKKTFADSNFLALASGEPPTLNLNTVPLEATFSSNPATVSALLEIRWSVPGETTRTATLSVEIQNSVILGTEATPAAIPDGKATQAEAEAGTDNAKWMTALRTAQAIEALAEPAYFGTTQPPAGSNYKFWVNTATGRQFALIGGQWLETSGSSTGDLGGTGTGGGGVTSYNDLTDKPTLGTAAATAASNYATAAQGAKADSASQPGHTHSIADTTGLQAALDAKQPAGSYAPATGIAPTAITGTAVITTDSRLSDSRAPLSHQHAITDVTDLSTSLASKISGTGVASMQVVTALPASPAPTTFYIVIPSGATTASAVTLGSVSLLTGGGSGGGGGGGGETVWTPASLTSLALWLDATSGLYDSTSGGALVTASGSGIGRWEDRSTNARHFTQSTVNSRPVLTTASLNGKNTITFDGTDDLLSLASAPGLLRAKTGATLIAVLKHQEILSTAGKPVFRVGGIRRFESRRIGATQRGIVTRRLDSDPTTDSRSPIGSISSDFELIADAVDYSASTVFMYKNGVLISQNPQGTAGATSDTDAATISIGVTCNIELAELIFYDRLLTTAERQQVETYLGTKWGIAL